MEKKWKNEFLLTGREPARALLSLLLMTCNVRLLKICLFLIRFLWVRLLWSTKMEEKLQAAAYFNSFDKCHEILSPWDHTCWPYECALFCLAVSRERGCCKVAARSPFLKLTLPWPFCWGPNHFTGRSKCFKSTIQDESAATDLL